VLRHRLKTNFNADAEGITAEELIRRLLASPPENAAEDRRDSLPDLLRSADARPA
jgi:MoxR-like ATPase